MSNDGEEEEGGREGSGREEGGKGGGGELGKGNGGEIGHEIVSRREEGKEGGVFCRWNTVCVDVCM